MPRGTPRATPKGNPQMPCSSRGPQVTRTSLHLPLLLCGMGVRPMSAASGCPLWVCARTCVCSRWLPPCTAGASVSPAVQLDLVPPSTVALRFGTHPMLPLGKHPSSLGCSGGPGGSLLSRWPVGCLFLSSWEVCQGKHYCVLLLSVNSSLFFFKKFLTLVPW